MTLKELAQRCGVSVSTVSRVVNGGSAHAAGKELTEKIWSAVRETGYVPNGFAQSLKLGGAQKDPAEARKLVCIFARSCDNEADQFFGELFRQIERACVGSGCRVTGIYPAMERKKGGELPELPDTDGVIILGRCSKNLYQHLKKKCKHLLFVGLNDLPERNCDQVVCSGYEAARTAVRHLDQLGHRRIAYVGEQSEEARYRGYFDAMKELGHPAGDKSVYGASQSVKGGYQSGLRLLEADPRPTAVFCANDITSMGVMRALQENGINIPQELSVVSIDNIELCKYCTPTLTSIHIPREDLAHFSVKLLLDRIDGGHSTPVRMEIPFVLIRRESSGKAQTFGQNQ